MELPDLKRVALALHDVTKIYATGKRALVDVDLIIPEGDFAFLVGPSGAGKSTLMKLLIRDELATTGMVMVAGQDLARLKRREVPKMRRKIGIVFQDFKLLPSKTVRENVAFALEVTGTPRREIGPAVERVLALVGLTAQGEQRPHQLSAASSSERPSPGPWSTTRPSSSPTSRPATSTRSSAGRSSSFCYASTSWARPCSWRPTMPRS
jgi:ABC-type ATPase involved in cell division